VASREGKRFFVWPEAVNPPGIQRSGSWFYGNGFKSLGMVETTSKLGPVVRDLAVTRSQCVTDAEKVPDTFFHLGRWGAYGGYGAVAYQEDLRAMQSERIRIRTTERVNTAATGRDVMQQVAEATADIRRKMTQKYQVEF
jgi:hypothetical protein